MSCLPNHANGLHHLSIVLTLFSIVHTQPGSKAICDIARNHRCDIGNENHDKNAQEPSDIGEHSPRGSEPQIKDCHSLRVLTQLPRDTRPHVANDMVQNTPRRWALKNNIKPWKQWLLEPRKCKCHDAKCVMKMVVGMCWWWCLLWRWWGGGSFIWIGHYSMRYSPVVC